MFLNKYINDEYVRIIYDNYDEDYLNLLKEDNFQKVYLVLTKYNFYFIQDIILNYLELFEYDEKYIELAIINMKLLLGSNFVDIIGNNMTLIDKVIELAKVYMQIKERI